MKKSRFSEEQMVRAVRESDVKRLKALESENARLKKILADRDLELDVMREINRKKW